MFFRNIRLSYLKLLRVLEIIWLVLTNVISDWFTDTRIYRLFRRAKSKEEVHRRSTQARIRAMIEDLGPTFVKFGQILADRPDLVSEKLRRELKKLQAAARPFDNDIAMQLVEEELGGPIDVFFESFHPTCIASASIGQVYTGILRSGESVVIKIQRPGIYSKIKIDLILMKVLASKLARAYPELASLNILSFVDEFGELVMKEMNYHHEANNILRFKDLMKDEPSFYAPKVYNEFTTKRILIMEKITGIAPDETTKLLEQGYDLNQIALNGCNIILKMILRHGVFHADPHPGNIFILPGNRICFIDYGMVSVLKTSHIQFLADFTVGFASKSPARIADSLLQLSGKKFFKHEDDLRFEVQEVINRYSYLPIDKVDISMVMMDCVALIIKYEIKIPSNIYMLLKALATIQKFAQKMQPDFSISAVLMPYAKDVIRLKFSPKRFMHEVVDVIRDYVALVKEFPGDMSEILYKAKQGKLVHEISVREDKELRKTLRVFSMNIALGLATALLLLCSTIVYVTGRDIGVARAGFTAALILAGWVYLRSFKHRLE